MNKKQRLENLPSLPDSLKPSEYTSPERLADMLTNSKTGKKKVSVQRVYQKIFGTKTEEPTLTAYKKDGHICVLIP